MKYALFLAFLLASERGSAQSAAGTLYFRAGSSYAFTNSGQLSAGGIIFEGTTDAGPLSTDNAFRKASMGAGIWANISGGYTLNRNMALELGLNGLVSPREFSYERHHHHGPGLGEYHRNETRARNTLYVMPGLSFRHELGKAGLLYTRASLILPVSGYTEYVHTQEVEATGVRSVSTERIRHRFGLGFGGCIGYNHRITRHLGVWLEANTMNLNRWTKSSSRMSFTENGADALSKLSVNQRETVFSLEPRYGTGENEPAQAPTFSIPYSSLGVSLGLSWTI